MMESKFARYTEARHFMPTRHNDVFRDKMYVICDDYRLVSMNGILHNPLISLSLYVRFNSNV